MKRTILLTLALTACLAAQVASAQTVGINTTTPDPSAALDIKDPQRGVLLPRVDLKSKSDNTTVLNPATGLLLYNLNTQMYAGQGFYYNEGTPQSPSWRSLADLKLPYTATGASNTMVDFQNYSNNTNSTTLQLSNVQGYALTTEGKLKISGNGQSPGLGKVLTSDASGNATWQGAIAFRASGVVGGGSEKIASGAAGEAKIPFSLQEYDLSNSYNEANATPHSTFMVPVNGVYHFDANISWNFDLDALTQLVTLTIYRKQALSTTVLGHITCQQGLSSVALSTDTMLQAGDQVYVTVLHTASQKYISLKSPSSFSGRLMVKQ